MHGMLAIMLAMNYACNELLAINKGVVRWVALDATACNISMPNLGFWLAVLIAACISKTCTQVRKASKSGSVPVLRMRSHTTFKTITLYFSVMFVVVKAQSFF